MGVLIRDISLGPPGVGGKFNGTILGIRIEKIKLIDLIYTIGAVNQYGTGAYPLWGRSRAFPHAFHRARTGSGITSGQSIRGIAPWKPNRSCRPPASCS